MCVSAAVYHVLYFSGQAYTHNCRAFEASLRLSFLLFSLSLSAFPCPCLSISIRVGKVINARLICLLKFDF